MKDYLKMLIQEIVMANRHDGWSLEWYKKKLKALTDQQSIHQESKNNENVNENQKPN
jgi:hypothetical protein